MAGPSGPSYLIFSCLLLSVYSAQILSFVVCPIQAEDLTDRSKLVETGAQRHKSTLTSLNDNDEDADKENREMLKRKSKTSK